MADRPVAIGLDLGSSRIKAAPLLDDGGDGRLGEVAALPAPPLWGEGSVREGDAETYADTALEVLRAAAAHAPPGTPVGIASQRSSFLLWERGFGRPLGPYVSWQDRRASAWCLENRERGPGLAERTGLWLSPYYAGPKIAAMRAGDPAFAAALGRDDVLWGNLDAFLIWRWSGGLHHETDLTMAARTMLVDLDTADWDAGLLELFGIPRGRLPAIARTVRREVRPLVDGLMLAASVSDQAAGILALLMPDEDGVLVHAGTGTFVLRETCDRGRRLPGLLTGPILGGDPPRFAVEGAINGSGPAFERFGGTDFVWPGTDPSPRAFMLPDAAGLGAPHWRDDLVLSASVACAVLDEPGRHRALVEGLAFRVAEIAEAAGPLPPAVTLAGGLGRDPRLGDALAAVLDRPVVRLDDREGGLLGVSRLAAGEPPYAAAPTVRVEPRSDLAWLATKRAAWQGWLDALLSV